jgi:SAM-dependent methyltransferase
MVSQELGLVLAHELLDLDDLHFGLWGDELDVSLGSFPAAQRRFTDYLLNRMPPSGEGRVLDVGCGTGALTERLVSAGYAADALSPSSRLNALARERLDALPGHDARVFDARLEDLALEGLAGAYGTVLFSESFQFVKMDIALDRVAHLLRTGGHLVICDMFKSGRQGDGGPGDGVIRGGQSLSRFQTLISDSRFAPVAEDDITTQVSPTIDLVADLLERRVAPAARALDSFLGSRHPLSWRIVRGLTRRRLRKVDARYFSGHYNRRTFERYKTYRYMTFRLEAA